MLWRYLFIHPISPPREECNTWSIFKQQRAGLNSVFPSPKLINLSILKNIIYLNPPTWTGCNTRSICKPSTAGLNSVFPSPKLINLSILKNIIYLNPPTWTGCNTRSICKPSTAGLNSVFPSPKLINLSILKNIIYLTPPTWTGRNTRSICKPNTAALNSVFLSPSLVDLSKLKILILLFTHSWKARSDLGFFQEHCCKINPKQPALGFEVTSPISFPRMITVMVSALDIMFIVMNVLAINDFLLLILQAKHSVDVWNEKANKRRCKKSMFHHSSCRCNVFWEIQ